MRWYIHLSGFSHFGQQKGEVHARIARQRQRVPEPAIDLQKNRGLAFFPPELDHGNSVPL
jgi:hypothetical protein